MPDVKDASDSEAPARTPEERHQIALQDLCDHLCAVLAECDRADRGLGEAAKLLVPLRSLILSLPDHGRIRSSDQEPELLRASKGLGDRIARDLWDDFRTELNAATRAGENAFAAWEEATLARKYLVAGDFTR